jgi:hypothetical protein
VTNRGDARLGAVLAQEPVTNQHRRDFRVSHAAEARGTARSNCLSIWTLEQQAEMSTHEPSDGIARFARPFDFEENITLSINLHEAPFQASPKEIDEIRATRFD